VPLKTFRIFAPAVAGLFLFIQALPCHGQAGSYNISTYVGTSPGTGAPATAGFAGDSLAPANAKLFAPQAVALDSNHDLYIADSGNSRIRKVSGGKVSTVAGSGTAPANLGYSGDGGAATSALLNHPYGVRVDSAGNIYISDIDNQVVRRVDGKSGNITTIAGVNGNYGYFDWEDGGPAANSYLDKPVGLAFDAAGNLYIGDSNDDRVRTIDTKGIIHTFAGANQYNKTPGSTPWTSYGGDGGPATKASLFHPYGVAVDAFGNVYIADSDDNRIRKVATDGTITTVAGNGTAGFSGDGGPAVNAQLNRPWDVAVDSSGDLFIADYNNQRIRLVDASGTITTIAGSTGLGYSGDGGAATAAKLNYPTGVAVDLSNGNVYIADSGNNVIRQLTPTTPSVSGVYTASGFGGFTSIAPGSWIEIYGTNLAFDRRSWTTSDFQGTAAPTSLNGTTVTVGGQSAFVDYISGSQINVLVPSNVTSGQQAVIVKNAVGSSSGFNVTVNSVKPGLLAVPSFKFGSTQYVVALTTDGNTFILPPGAIAGLATQRAAVGQTIVLYGVGFGPVSPSVTDGQPAPAQTAVTNGLHIFVGGVEAKVTYAGLTPGSYGLYQFNVVIPQVPAGDQVPLTFTLGGASGGQTLYLPISLTAGSGV
jgi:uncharacterized protein (TIGR03437 family)